MAKVIMVQGTMSNAGKSLIAAGLCRVFKQDGYKVCPFKSQNMALNSYITKEGLEMGRAQVMQAEAAGIEPSVCMNPILLKPNSDTGSQIIVNGEVQGNMDAREYYANKQRFVPDIMKSYEALAKEYDIIVIEGAGSPAEINLKENDLVNMGIAEMVDAPVILVGDIDLGGVFAQLYGTVKLLEQKEQNRIKGLVINKFRGDVSILEPGLTMLEKLTSKPVIGVVPYMHLDMDDEDSLSKRLHCHKEHRALTIAVIRFPRLSNFTDFAVFEQSGQACVVYVEKPEQLGQPDMIILPGTKSTIADLLWMRQNGLEAVIQKAAARGTVIFGVCGGYQMLGTRIQDPFGMEGGGQTTGMGLLPVSTTFLKEKHRTQLEGKFQKVEGLFSGLSGKSFQGYEIHHGATEYEAGAVPLAELSHATLDGAQKENVYGSYVHGIFDDEAVSGEIIRVLLREKGYSADGIQTVNREEYKQQQYDLLADGIRENIDMEAIYRILN